jgi:hypothetical protein
MAVDMGQEGAPDLTRLDTVSLVSLMLWKGIH